MADQTLLDYVQTILSSLDSDEVNSYDDTVESLQVANVIKTAYNQIQARSQLPEHYTIFELNASGDALSPVKMFRPSDVMSIDWVQYDKRETTETNENYVEVTYVPVEDFLRMQNGLDIDETEVAEMSISIGVDSLTYKYRNDRAPSFYTTYDDRTLLFDSYDASVDTTLQKEKTRCYGKKDQTFTMSNVYVPFFDRDMSTLLLNEAKILAFAELKQAPHTVAQQWARRGWVKSQKDKQGVDNKVSNFNQLPHFGRK